MILQLVDFKYHKTLVQQVELLVRVQQVIVLPAKIVGSQYVKKIGEVEILLPVVFLFQYLSEFPLHELIKSIERRNQLLVFFYPFDEQVDRHRKGYFLGTANGIRIPFPKGHNQRFNGLFLLQVKDLVVGEKRIKGYRTFFTICIVNSVLPVCALVYQFA